MFRFIDICVISAAWLTSYWLRFQIPIIEVKKGFPKFSNYAALTPLVAILWTTVFSAMKVYQSKRMLRRTHEVHLILRAHIVSILFFIALTYMFSEYKYSRAVMAYFGVFGGFLLIVFRLSLRNALRSIRRKGFNLRHVLMVGEGPAVETLTTKLDKFPELGLRVVGIITNENSHVTSVAKKPVIGHFGQIHEIISKTRADKLLIALPRSQYGELDSILAELKDETIDMQLVPDIHEFVTLGCEIEDFDGLPLVNLNDSPLDGWGAIAKRMTDFIISGLGLIALSPLILLASILIKLTSRGPVFYSQTRMGLDGKTFVMYKFRSMKTDAETKSGAIWASSSDNRRTAIGSLLRTTSLDELPQLFNVMRGDMSLVGPRPERPIFVSRFRNEIPHYMLRHKVKAGMTGWAQVNGWRGNTSLNNRIECDLFYIRNWSYMLDWKIMFMTLWKGFVNKNAY
ncbi:MAG: undecaprenyl-phosphate glucose phosphotransferase [Bdellovibrionota bacterium]